MASDRPELTSISSPRARSVWAIGRYDDVRAALHADSILVSSRGTALAIIYFGLEESIAHLVFA